MRDRLLPDIPLWSFRISIVIGVLAILLLTRFQNFYFPESSPIDNVTGFPLLDPLLIHLYSGIILSLVIFWGSFYSDKQKNPILNLLKAFGFTFLLVSFIFLLEILLEEYWLKPAFFYNRPPQEYQKPDTWLTAYIESLMGWNSEPGAPTSTPSGFVMRQLFLSFLLLIYGETLKKASKLKKVLLVYGPALLFFLLVVFLRVWRGKHSFFDVGIAIGTGTLLFWPFWLFIYSILGKDGMKIYIRDFIVPSGFLFCFSFIFSGHSTSWAYASLIIFGLLGIGYTKAIQVSGRKS